MIVSQIEYATLIDESTGGVTYIGQADPGSASSSPVWRIKKVLESGGDVTITFADGDSNFDNIWDNRASLTYS